MKKSGFKTSYSRYHYSKNKWILKESSEDLLWEAEDGSKRLGVSLPDFNRFSIP